MHIAALAADDSNGDRVIDASDPVFGQLRIWRDLNGNGTVDAGELETLQQAGIAAINLASTPQAGVVDAGNLITATGSITRADGTTGTIADVAFKIDNFNTTFLGNKSVSAAAAALPDLKGYGTLTDLHVALTLSPALIDAVNADLPSLAAIDIAQLRNARRLAAAPRRCGRAGRRRPRRSNGRSSPTLSSALAEASGSRGTRNTCDLSV
jgi:hypothetical protein